MTTTGAIEQQQWQYVDNLALSTNLAVAVSVFVHHQRTAVCQHTTIVLPSKGTTGLSAMPEVNLAVSAVDCCFVLQCCVAQLAPCVHWHALSATACRSAAMRGNGAVFFGGWQTLPTLA